MALISFFSAKGAPGVTSTAMLVAALWPRPTLLVDADGIGGDIALRSTAPTGAALTRNPSLLTLLPLARHGLAPGVVLDHTQVALGGQRVLVGLENPEQAEAGGALWPILARAFQELPGMDVVVDAGQLTARSGQLALAQRSHLAVGVVRAEPSSVVHMRRRAAYLAETFATLGGDAPRLGLVCVEGVQGQSEASSAVATITADVRGVLDLGQVAFDPKAVRMFHGEPVGRPERTMLVRSGRTLVQRLVAAVGPSLSAPPAPPAHTPAPLADTPPAAADTPPAAADIPPAATATPAPAATATPPAPAGMPAAPDPAVAAPAEPATPRRRSLFR